MADAEESFLTHLIELRTRLIRALTAILIVFIPMAFSASAANSLSSAIWISLSTAA